MQRSLIRCLCKKPNNTHNLIGTRTYQSLAIQINHDPLFSELSQTIDKPTVKPYKETSKHRNLPLIVRKLQAQVSLNSTAAARFIKLNEYLTKDFKLNDELLIHLIYTQQKDHNMYIQIEQDGVKSMIDPQCLRETGFAFYDLQSTLFLLILSEHNHEMTTTVDITNHRIFKYFKSKETLNEYLKLNKFEEFIVTDNNTNNKGKKVYRDTFFKTLGMLSLTYGNEVALKFLKERVFDGNNGILQLAIAKL